MSDQSSENPNPPESAQQDDTAGSNKSGEASAIDGAKRAAQSSWAFLRRQKVPAFLLFYYAHWRDVFTYIRDSFSSPADSELWIRDSDPSPGVYREGAAWDIDASSHCVICGAVRSTERHRVRSIVRDFDGMIYGVLAAILAAIVLWIATGSWLIAIGVLLTGLWGARRLVVEEQVRMHCSTCPKHEGEEQSLHLRLKRETLIIELGSRKARLAFLRKSREASGVNPWEADRSSEPDDPASTAAPQQPAPPPAVTLPLAGLAEADEDDDDASGPTFSDVAPPAPTAPLPRIRLADTENESQVEFHTFDLHTADGQSVDQPLVSAGQKEESPVSHYFQPDSSDAAPADPEVSARPAAPQLQSYNADSVLIPASDNASGTIPLSSIPLSSIPLHDEPSDGNWFCRIDGIEIGPVPLEKAQKLKSSGSLKSTDAVRREAETDWASPDTLPGLAPPHDNSVAEEEKPPGINADPWSEKTDGAESVWDPWSD